MEVTSVRIEEGEEPGTRRLVADVSHGRNRRETVWLEVAEEHAAALSTRADPWICYSLPLAALHRDPVIRVEGTASRRLVENVPRLLSIWRSWYPKLRSDVSVKCDGVTDETEINRGKTGLFFSGGVDSWFSLLHEDQHGKGVQAMVAVLGWDIPLSNAKAVANMIQSHQRVADDLGKDLVVVKTNMRDGRFGERKWGPLTHGAALAMVAHALSKEFSRLIISATHSRSFLRPWGSHPDTDPLFSSESVEISHHGLDYDRVERTRLLARHQVALNHLHVCWRTWDETNCGHCEKCLRTMLALELLGALERSPTFPVKHVRPEQYRNVKATSPGVRHWMVELRNLAIEVGRTEFVDELDRCMSRGRVYEIVKKLVPEAIGGPDGLLGKPLRAIWKRI